ncbi:UNVERIFIED_ORG: hypothetical protein GCAPEGMB_00401 [Vibrio phage V07]
MHTFKLQTEDFLTCDAAIFAAAESNEVVTVLNIEFDYATGECTVQCTHPVTMREADAFARHCVAHAPLTRYVLDNNGDITDYLWCALGSNDHAVINRTTGETHWCYNPEAVTQYLFDNDVYAPYAQFE